MPAKFYEGILADQRSTKKLFGEFFGYQIYRDLCTRTGEFQADNDAKPLFKCDLTNRHEAGDILKKMMSIGYSKTWREIIKDLSPLHETKLQGSAFLDYYKPLHIWIGKDNADRNIPVGWEYVNYCLKNSRM
ncbi:angiotensin-converting enzyme-like [Haematobia irritans]|uniref:angiotensin-converting enzyme-like n=1 Tax=Haematobia irritans TaxID=7368 RepID=UPI003F4FB2E5